MQGINIGQRQKYQLSLSLCRGIYSVGLQTRMQKSSQCLSEGSKVEEFTMADYMLESQRLQQLLNPKQKLHNKRDQGYITGPTLKAQKLTAERYQCDSVLEFEETRAQWTRAVAKTGALSKWGHFLLFSLFKPPTSLLIGVAHICDGSSFLLSLLAYMSVVHR